MGTGQLKGQLLQKGGQIGFGADKAGAGAGVTAHRMQREGEHQQLLEYQTIAGKLGALPVGGKMDVLQSKVQVAQLILLTEKGGQRVGDFPVRHLQRLRDIGRNHLGGKSLCQRVDRNQPACLLNRVDGGCGHLCPSGCAGPAVEQILLVIMEGIDGVFGIKKGDDHAAGIVCHPHAGDGHAAADILRCTFGHDAGFDPTGFPGRQSGNLTGRGQVDIGAREIVEQIPNGKDVQLLVERGSFGTHAGQKLYVGIQRRFHAAPH